VTAVQTANELVLRKGAVAAKAVHWSDDPEPFEIVKIPVAVEVVLVVVAEEVAVPMTGDCHCCSDASVLEPLREHQSVLQIPAALFVVAVHCERGDVHSVDLELAS